MSAIGDCAHLRQDRKGMCRTPLSGVEWTPSLIDVSTIITMPNALYVHIPFCIKKCRYCDFSSSTIKGEPPQDYIETLLKEASARSVSVQKIDTLYIGGGTPTIYPAKTIAKLLNGLKNIFSFRESAEITVEANPATVDIKKIINLSESGVNRISLGVQSFDNRELDFLGRVHTEKDAIKAAETIKKGGIKNLSIDLLYGIPGQSEASWTKNLKKAINIRPQHISTYELTAAKETPLYRILKKHENEHEEEIAQMYYKAIDILNDSGYSHYEISNFSIDNCQCHHNINYWRRGRYIGLGTSAHSFIGNKRVSNTRDTGEYIELVSFNKNACKEESPLTKDDEIKETIMLGLRMKEGLDTEQIRENYGIDMLSISKDFLSCRLLTANNNKLSFTKKGFALSNYVISSLFNRI